jgi:glycerol kinase
MNARYILAIDQSTSATKALVYDFQFRMVERFSVEHRGIYPKAGWVEHDAEELWRNTLAVIRLAIEKYGKEAFSCLSITNQRETFVVFDRATGKPLHHAVVWQCRRGDDVCAELMHAGKGAEVSEKTGLKIDSYFSGPKITALVRAQPALKRALESGAAGVSTIDAYLVHRLTGGRVFATDPTNASRTLLYDIRSLTWDRELCDLFEVPMNALPEVRDSTARFGECAIEPVSGLPICGVMGDSQAALFAHRCFTPGQAKVTLGTGSSLLLNVGERLPASGVRAVAWAHRGRPTYCLEGIISYSAATIAWLRDQLGLIQNAEETEAAARAVPDNGGVYLVPAFAGLSAPHWSPDARAAIVGLSGASTRNHVIRAALESIAYQIRDALEYMKREGGVELSIIHADGGATNNRFLMQFIADMLGEQIVAADVADFSPMGAAMAGGLAMGLYPSLEKLGDICQEGQVYAPTMSKPEADRLHKGWATAVRQVLAGT